MVVKPRRASIRASLGLTPTSLRDDYRVVEERLLPKCPTDGVAIHAGHVKVEQDGIRSVFLGRLNCEFSFMNQPIVMANCLTHPPNGPRYVEMAVQAGIQPVWFGPRQLWKYARSMPSASLPIRPWPRRMLAERSAEDIAAALVRLYHARLPAIEDVTDPGERPVAAHKRPVYTERPVQRGRSAPEDRDYSKAGRPRGGKHSLGGGAWFRIDVGRAKGADPKWLVPMICRAGGLTKADIGTIRVFDHETKFEISAEAENKFTADIKRRIGETPRIEPLGSAGEGGTGSRVGGKPDEGHPGGAKGEDK